MIERDLAGELRAAAKRSPAITLTGPRQSGKTTLCQAVFPRHPHVSLEDLDLRDFAIRDPRGFLGKYPKGAVLDEIQRAPDLLSYLQGMIDADPAPGRWILTGSQNFALLDSVSQSLAGRTEVFHLLPLTYREILRFPRPPESLEEVLFTGGYPRIYDRHLPPEKWMSSYAATYVERDVRTIRSPEDLHIFQNFMSLCAGRTAGLNNYSSLANDCGISQPTAKAWLGILEASFLVFFLQAFRSNLKKRIVKMPKLHFYDTGLACWLLGIRAPEQLHAHPLRGQIFESWVASELAKHLANRGETRRPTFYRDSSHAEINLIFEHADGIMLVEAKSAKTASSSLFDSVRRVRRHFSDLTRPCSVMVVYGGDDFQDRREGMLVPWNRLHEGLRSLSPLP